MVDAGVGFSCLANYEHFARHVALHELGADGVVDVTLWFADDAYADDPDAYFDGPE